MARDLTKMQVDNVDTYLNKSGDNMHEFMDKNPHSQVYDVEGMGWIEYDIIDDIFWIHTAFSKLSNKDTKEIWKSIIKLAKYEGCTKIQFTTKRNPKAFERLYNVKPVQWKLELDLTKELL